MSVSFHTNAEVDDEVRLFARARSGDEAAWDELFRRCYPKILRVIRRKLNHSMRPWYDSADFASDVMKSLAARADRLEFETPAKLMSFLRHLAEEKVVDGYRHAHREMRDITRQLHLGQDEAGILPLLADETTASQIAVATEAREALMAGQSEPERVAIGLRQDGYTVREIAEHNGWHIRKVQRFFNDLWVSFQGDTTAPRPSETKPDTAD